MNNTEKYNHRYVKAYDRFLKMWVPCVFKDGKLYSLVTGKYLRKERKSDKLER